MDIYSIIETIVIVVIVLVIYYFATWSNRKNAKELKKMQDTLKKGDKVVTLSGLAGVIDKVEEDRIIISLYPDKVKISVEKWAVASLDDRTID